MRNSSKCGVAQVRVKAARPHPTHLVSVVSHPPASSRDAGDLRPFIIAAVVFLLLLVGARVAAGYYAVHAPKAALRLIVPDTVPNVDSNAATDSPSAAPEDLAETESSYW